MGKFFAVLVLSFVIIFIINAVWSIWNFYVFVNEGIQTLFVGKTFSENIIFSIYFKWILLIDAVWWVFLFIYLKFTSDKTNNFVNYLTNEPIKEPKICFVTFTYNEAAAIESILQDLKSQKYVTDVIVVDNHSTDSTVEIAEKNGAKVITKEKNMGLPHSWVLGQKEALKTEANIIVIIEADGTCTGKDIEKMLPYLDHCDTIITTRQEQVLTEKGNQNNTMHTWGNYIVAKLLQIKYLTIRHFGVILLTDIGCSYRCIRREGLEKIVGKITFHGTDKVIVSSESGLFTILFTILGIENDLKSVEVPVTFKKRVGSSKTRSDEKIKGFRYGLNFIWFILWR